MSSALQHAERHGTTAFAILKHSNRETSADRIGHTVIIHYPAARGQLAPLAGTTEESPLRSLK